MWWEPKGSVSLILAMFVRDRVKLTAVLCILFPFLVFVISLLLEKTHRKTRWFRISIFVLYVGLILYLTVLRNNIETDHQIQLVPFWSYEKFYDPQYRWQIYMNVFLFIPFGFLLGWALNRNVLHVILLGAGFSVCLEAAQYIYYLGLCDIDDVIHNTLGTVIGYIYWVVLKGSCVLLRYIRIKLSRE